MTARRAAASIIMIAAIAALAGCSDPEPTEEDYRAAHVAFWMIGTQVAQEETGRSPREDQEALLEAEWDDPAKSSTWRPVYDGVCDELREGGEPDLILELARQLEKQGIGQDAARAGVVKQAVAIAENLCPSQVGTAEGLAEKLTE